MTITNAIECSEIIHSTKRRRRWTPYEKQELVHETYQPGVTVSFVARHSLVRGAKTWYTPEPIILLAKDHGGRCIDWGKNRRSGRTGKRGERTQKAYQTA